MAFATLVGAFSLVVTQFQSISSYASVITRLSELVDASESAFERDTSSCLDCKMSGENVVYSQLSLRMSDTDDRVLLDKLDATFERGRTVLVAGPNPAAKAALFRATAALHEAGSGGISRPPPGKLAFLLEQPYLPPGTLREVLTPPEAPAPVTDAEIVAVFEELQVQLPGMQEGKFDQSRRWDDELNLNDGQLFAVARALLTKPDFIFLDHPETALDGDEFALVRAVAARRGATAVVFNGGKATTRDYDCVLEIAADGSWKWRGPEGQLSPGPA
jgi:putative ATP-binding cassette transporter